MINTINPNNPKQKIRSALSGNVSSSRAPKPGFKFNPQMIFGGLLLVMLLIGGAAGLYLTQINQDLRQQASTLYNVSDPTPSVSIGSSCADSNNNDRECVGDQNNKQCVKCVDAVWISVTNSGLCPDECNGEAENPTPTPTQEAGTGGGVVDCTAENNGWEDCDCEGTIQTTECQLGYNEWRCGTKRWIPVYDSDGDGGSDDGNKCVDEDGTSCPWERAANDQCCPTSPDACNNIGDIICIEDPYASVCELWDASCPAGQQNYYRAFDWSDDYEGDIAQYCDGATPTPPTTTPTPPITSPTPTNPVGPQCHEITAYNTTGGSSTPLTGNEDDNLVPGSSSVRFVCAANSIPLTSGYSYKFRIWEPCATSSIELASTGNAVNYPINLAGDYAAQCAVCNDSTNNCDWEAYTPTTCN